MTLPRIMVAPNGARLQKSDHPAVPLTLDEIIDCAAQCHAAGAGGLHLHLRDAGGRHLLDAGAYREALTALSARCPGMLVQVTTEAAGRYPPREQRHVALNSGAGHISVALREMLREPHAAPGFYRRCATSGIAVQHILYDVADARRLKTVLSAAQFTSPRLQLLFVLGRYAGRQEARPAHLDPFLAWLAAEGISPDWAACAFGRHETDCLLYAARTGGKCRIGFENSTLRRDGTRADSNADRVRELRGLLPPHTGQGPGQPPVARHAAT